MKAIAILLLVIVITSCSIKPAIHDREPLEQTEQSSYPLSQLPIQWSLDNSKSNQALPSLNELLRQRTSICALDDSIQSQQLKLLKQRNTSLASLQLLILSSCRPEMMPGIMRNALTRLDRDQSLSSDYHSFFSIMNAQLNAADRLAKEQQSLIEQLNKTVEELTRIEKDIESRTNSTEPMEPFSR